MYIISLWKDLKTCIQSNDSKEEIISASGKYLVISDQLLKYPEMTYTGIIGIRFICCNQEITIALTVYGTIIGWGDNKRGLLGKELGLISTPIRINKLSNINKISLAECHAAAIDESGLLFTWGSPDYGKLGYSSMLNCFEPELVPSCLAFKSVDVVCGEKFTCIRSEGCFIHIYGEIGYSHSIIEKKTVTKAHQRLRSFSHPELDNYSVVQLVGGSKFISVLVETGEVYILDDCMDLIRLPIFSKSKIDQIIAGPSSIWGLSHEYITTWQSNEDTYFECECSLSLWNAYVCKIRHKPSVYAFEDHFITCSSNDSIFESNIFEISPYKKSEIRSKSICKHQETERSSTQLGNKAFLNNFEDLSRLYSGENSYKFIKAIINCRKEYNSREIIMRAFSNFLYPDLKEIFEKIKKHSLIINIYRRAITAANICTIILSIYKSQYLNSFLLLKNFYSIDCQYPTNIISGIWTDNRKLESVEDKLEISCLDCDHSELALIEDSCSINIKQIDNHFQNICKRILSKRFITIVDQLYQKNKSSNFQRISCPTSMITNILKKLNFKILMIYWSALKAKSLYTSLRKEITTDSFLSCPDNPSKVLSKQNCKSNLSSIFIPPVDLHESVYYSLSPEFQKNSHYNFLTERVNDSIEYLDKKSNEICWSLNSLCTNSPNLQESSRKQKSIKFQKYTFLKETKNSKRDEANTNISSSIRSKISDKPAQRI